MATPKALNALQKTKEALNDIKSKLEPVVQRLKDDAFEKATAQAQATVSLSIGMMKYMGARLQGLDQGRKPDDALRNELNQMRKVLAEIKARHSDDKKPQAQKRMQEQSKKSEGSTGDQKEPSIAKQLLTKKKANEPSQSPASMNEDATPDTKTGTDNQNPRNNNKRNADNSKRRTKKRKTK